MPHLLGNRVGETLDASHAVVDLASIPFVRLRQGLPTGLLEGKSSFTEVVERANLASAPCTLNFDFSTNCINYGESKRYSLKLTNNQFQLLSFVYALKKHDRDEFMPGYLEEWDRFLDFLANAFQGDSLLAANLGEKVQEFVRANGLTSARYGQLNSQMESYLESTKSRLKTRLENYYGQEIADRILYRTHSDKSGDTYYKVDMEPDCIHFLNTDEAAFFCKR